MNVLSALPWWVLVPGTLLVIATIAFLLRSMFEILLGSSKSQAASFAAPLMPALGVLFAFMSGFAITAMWGGHTAAELTVSKEATASDQLAWAATARNVDTQSIQTALVRYIDSVVESEWPLQSQMSQSLNRQSADIKNLQQAVRSSASDPTVGQADAAALINGVDDLSTQRAARLGASKSSMPLALFIALVVSGLALCLNALFVSVAGERRSRMVTYSIIVVVALDLAVLLILAGPFTGSQQVSNSPLIEVREQIITGQMSSEVLPN
ncbi:MAG: DUF4239 domain-containing protein [Actinobacteria bacterium]|uniref:Unannotated protein n=1 Tax=freshwater metagenome TaxID=449393 RepID=A0A6J5YF75_9ZZZZ|nr:DUF4239 domain-containing protein [Actinomycetota bacterium]MTA76779.1 DUF4239 domain-containing protein [Actinomycetota bacterium]